MLRAMGADVVGMATVPGVIAAVPREVWVLALSIIPDLCPDTVEPVRLEQIIATAHPAGPRLVELVRGVLARTVG